MRNLVWVACFAACSSPPSGPDVVVTTSFVVTTVTGSGTSPLDPLLGQTIELKVTFVQPNATRGDETDTPTCKSTVLEMADTPRIATGATADLVTTQILDELQYWDIRMQLCNTASESSITVHSEIDPLNLAFGCAGIPATAFVRNDDGFPEITSFTATQCHATILDVVNNRILNNSDFEIGFVTGRTQIP